MNVYTYYVDIGWPKPTTLIDLWAESWRRRGWNPIIIGPAEAEKSAYYPKLVEEHKKHPTVNDPRYDFANKARYCAMEALGGGVLTDYDVINYTLSTERLKFYAHSQEMIVFGTGGFFSMTKEGAQNFCNTMINWTTGDKKCALLNGKPHLSDMYMHFFINTYRIWEVSPLYGDGNWQTAPTVHYSNGKVHTLHDAKMDKGTLVASLRPI
jgi:hypothetical protein